MLDVIFVGNSPQPPLNHSREKEWPPPLKIIIAHPLGKLWMLPKKNFHIIFVSITSIEGTPLFKEKGQFFWSLKTRFAFNKGTP